MMRNALLGSGIGLIGELRYSSNALDALMKYCATNTLQQSPGKKGQRPILEEMSDHSLSSSERFGVQIVAAQFPD